MGRWGPALRNLETQEGSKQDEAATYCRCKLQNVWTLVSLMYVRPKLFSSQGALLLPPGMGVAVE